MQASQPALEGKAQDDFSDLLAQWMDDKLTDCAADYAGMELTSPEQLEQLATTDTDSCISGHLSFSSIIQSGSIRRPSSMFASLSGQGWRSGSRQVTTNVSWCFSNAQAKSLSWGARRGEAASLTTPLLYIWLLWLQIVYACMPATLHETRLGVLTLA
jgi:hypothetical protein